MGMEQEDALAVSPRPMASSSPWCRWEMNVRWCCALRVMHSRGKEIPNEAPRVRFLVSCKILSRQIYQLHVVMCIPSLSSLMMLDVAGCLIGVEGYKPSEGVTKLLRDGFKSIIFNIFTEVMRWQWQLQDISASLLRIVLLRAGLPLYYLSKIVLTLDVQVKAITTNSCYFIQNKDSHN